MTFPQSANHVEFRLNVHRNSMSWNIGTTYPLVWATKLLLAAIGLVFPALVLG
jgi:hypothetical protein